MFASTWRNYVFQTMPSVSSWFSTPNWQSQWIGQLRCVIHVLMYRRDSMRNNSQQMFDGVRWTSLVGNNNNWVNVRMSWFVERWYPWDSFGVNQQTKNDYHAHDQHCVWYDIHSNMVIKSQVQSWLCRVHTYILQIHIHHYSPVVDSID